MRWTLKDISMTLVAILVLLLGASVGTVAVSPIVYSLYSQMANLGAAVGLTHEQLMENYYSIWSYLFSPIQQTFSMPYFSSSEAGAQHFHDVKIIIWIALILWILLVGVLLWWLFHYWKKREYKLWRQYYARIIQWFPVGLLCLIVVAFDKVFILFHKLLFSNDLWLFDVNLDPVILVLPQSFFMICFVVALVLYEIGAILYLLLGRWKFGK